ncbi:MAG TPA: hypothetical protein VIJ96_13545 [Acidothermaceae bacterium]
MIQRISFGSKDEPIVGYGRTTMVEVSSLVDPSILAEIEATAYRDRQS